MSNLPGNPHAYDAEFAISSSVLSADDSGTQNIESLLIDNARATLALAYEQRTANLIAYAEQMRRDRTSGTNAATTEVLMTVEERLGLGETK